MATYTLAGQQFSSKEEVAKHAKGIKDRAQPGDILEGSDLLFMYDLLLWHPDAAQKIGAGVKTILVRANPLFGHNEFYLLRADGSATEFSYKQCVQPSTPEADFRTACRVAISADIVEFERRFFRENPINPLCPLTGERLTTQNSHVDHAPPTTFHALLTEFVATNHLTPGKVELIGRNIDNSFRVRIADPELEQKWVAFHRANAKLRVISKHANLSIVGKDWGEILEYLWMNDFTDVLVEWKGKRQFYSHIPGMERGILLAADKAPEGTPVLDGALALIEMSLIREALP